MKRKEVIMSKKRQRFFYLLCCCMVLWQSCVPPEEPGTNSGTNENWGDIKGIYILNEGVIDMNNSMLSYYDCQLGTLRRDIFKEVNHRGLGDTGNDLQRYGQKLYVVVSRSEQLEILDIYTARSLAQVPLTGKQPRSIAFFRDKGYVSCLDGDVVQIDTLTLSVEKIRYSGENPEGIHVANGKLYVANSGGLNFPRYNQTLSVFSLPDLTLQKNIRVVANPYVLASNDVDNIYLVSRGNYEDIPYALQRISTQVDSVICQFEEAVLNFTLSGEALYVYHYDFNTRNSWLKKIHRFTGNPFPEQLIADGTRIETPYALAVNDVNGDFFITDAHQFTVNGDLFCFDKNGKKKLQIEVGINPSRVVLVK
jgi:DNA-binding beta-propeller fold protein YncE